MKREDVVRKAAALLRLAERGGTVGEAAAAAAAAQALLDKHQLTRGCIADAQSQAEEQAEADEAMHDFSATAEGQLDSHGRRITARWRITLGSALARMHGCYSWTGYRSGKRTHELAGRPSQVGTVRYLYGWLTREITRLVDSHGRGMGLVWRRSFCDGAAEEVITMLREQRERTLAEARGEYAGSSLALVRIDGALARMSPTAARVFAHTKHSFGRGAAFSGRTEWSAKDAGRSAARSSINVSPARGGQLGGRVAGALRG